MIGRGQFYLLSHPGSEIFSGYGVTVEEGRPDYLVGLLMVDRPHPVDAAWLEQITTLYGEYQLVAMTRTGERGIATQMYVALGSLRFLRPAPASMAAPFTASLATTAG